MNENQLQNAVAFIRTGARTISNQEQDNAKAATILATGEDVVKALVEMVQPEASTSETSE